ncbi:recombinase family protein [Brevibacillus brevis]|uniref:recombinase family protein n=1 Tax=Brevibacillus brevis TaxID=1393 RepID=UPI0007D8B398|nr:recombinase family protein [Brevibacillus brevis]
MKKRVWALYRVSTDKQVTDEDIPMQKNAVYRFIEKRKDWELSNELSELGVSGFKKSVQQRDKLQLIKKGAQEGKFDVLVVWKDDRLGRNKFEIPFMLEFLGKHGIEVWSVEDGILNKDEKHEDSLLSFLRFWVAEGESKKTSVRVTEAIKQMNELGKWTGNKIPFGYEMYDTGIVHPKSDKTIKEIKIKEMDSIIVKLIFYLVLEKGYGADRIANFLNENGYSPREGGKWRNNVVRRILRNPIYIGRQRYNINDKDGIKLKPKREDLVILPDEIFYNVQDVLNKRNAKQKGDSDSELNLPTKSKNLLLSGIARCGYCRAKLYADSSTKTKLKSDGTKSSYTYWRYVCRESLNHRETHPKSYFGAKRYEPEIEKHVINMLNSFVNAEEFDETALDTLDSQYEQKCVQIQAIKKEIQNLNTQLEAVKGLIIKIAMGESKLTENYVVEQIGLKEAEIKKQQNLIEVCEKEKNELEDRNKKFRSTKQELETWEYRYRKGDHDTKKTMLANALDVVYFFDKEFEIELNYYYEEILKRFKMIGKAETY